MNSDCKKTTQLSVCAGPSCSKKFSMYVHDRAVAESKKKDSVSVSTCACCGNCEKGVSVKITKNEKTELHSYVDPIKVAKIIDHL